MHVNFIPTLVFKNKFINVLFTYEGKFAANM